MRELAEELANAHEALSRLHSNLAEIYRRKVSELGAVLRDPAHGTEALGILPSLIDKVTLTPSDDHFAIGLEGALAGMLALAQTGKWPRGIAVSEVFRSSVSGPRHR